MTGMFDRKWKGCTSVPKHWELLKWTSKIFANFNHWLKRMTCWRVISLRWCRIMANDKCFAIRLKRKNLLLPTPDACSQLLALSGFIRAGQPLQHGEARDSYLAWVRPVAEPVRPCQQVNWFTQIAENTWCEVDDGPVSAHHWRDINLNTFNTQTPKTIYWWVNHGIYLIPRPRTL